MAGCITPGLESRPIITASARALLLDSRNVLSSSSSAQPSTTSRWAREGASLGKPIYNAFLDVQKDIKRVTNATHLQWLCPVGVEVGFCSFVDLCSASGFPPLTRSSNTAGYSKGYPLSRLLFDLALEPVIHKIA